MNFSRLLDVGISGFFVVAMLVSMYLCYSSLLVDRSYRIFTTEEEVETALELSLAAAVQQLF